ncbi:OmpW/AlkL family protein [Peristeroidobacter soli]|jgi:outer membrane protein|uniref:OmpW/AlkL family protein n=1 Tax=Peristeroidobacter soli TaxID=2497877 RepID=UPI001300BBE2|nr:OmpW family outer membrane protein [Peristeroidobacter soli]
MNTRFALLGCLIAATLAASAQADEQVPRHWIARIGVHPVDPQPDNHSQFTVDNAAGLSAGATYLFTKHWAVELFSAFPAGFDLHDADGTRVARFSMVPSSATLQYHITDASGIFRAYVGAGLSYAYLGGEQTKGSLGGQTLRLDDSTGLAAAIGLDMDLGSKWFVNIDARWMDIDSAMKIDGASHGSLQLDPYMFGLSVGRRLR